MSTVKRWYYDTEFLEDGKTIELLSIGLIADTGESYYAVNEDFPMVRGRADPFLKQHVLPKIGSAMFFRPRRKIAAQVQELLVSDVAGQPVELWADFGAYDHVVLCQLFGRMVDLPKGIPWFTHDLCQELRRLGVRRSDLPQGNPEDEHNALSDARVLRDQHQFLLQNY